MPLKHRAVGDNSRCCVRLSPSEQVGDSREGDALANSHSCPRSQQCGKGARARCKGGGQRAYGPKDDSDTEHQLGTPPRCHVAAWDTPES